MRDEQAAPEPKGVTVKLLAALALVLLASWGCDDWRDDAARARGLVKGTVWELKQDLFLYCCYGEYQLVRPERASFTMAEFKKNPAIGVVDQSANVAFIAIVPKGAQARFTRIRKRFEVNTGGTYDCMGTISDARFSTYREIVITHTVLEGCTGPTGKYLRVVSANTNQLSCDVKAEQGGAHVRETR